MRVPESTPHVGSPYGKPGYNSRNTECKLIGTQNEQYFTRASLQEMKINKVQFPLEKTCQLFRLGVQWMGFGWACQSVTNVQ